MGKVFRLTWELNLLLSCFRLSALYLCIYFNRRWPRPPAWHSSTMVLARYCTQCTSMYCSGKLDSTWQKTRRPHTFSHLAVLFIYAVDRVDTRVSFIQNSKDFHAKRVSYFAKKCSLFREISCFAKLVLACERQFPMFRISRNRTFSIRNETKLQSQTKKLLSSN